MEGSDSLSVETKVLGKGLAQQELDVKLHEESDGVGILLEVTRGKSLVGRVEEDEVTILDDSVGNLSPLLLGWIAASWVVSAGVEQEYRASWSSIQGFEEAINVQALFLSVPIWVLLVLEVRLIHHLLVVSPGWVWNVND